MAMCYKNWESILNLFIGLCLAAILCGCSEEPEFEIKEPNIEIEESNDNEEITEEPEQPKEEDSDLVDEEENSDDKIEEEAQFNFDDWESNLLTTSEIEALCNEEIAHYKYSVLLKGCIVEDPINNEVWRYNILLPTSYDEGKEYAVLYLLHGRGSSHNAWIYDLKIQQILEYVSDEGLEDMIVVMPFADNTYYVDGYQDDIKYEAYFHEVFLPFIEENYSVARNKEGRYIGGFSMGGYGAWYYTVKYEDYFSLCYAMSAPLNGNGDSRIPQTSQFLENYTPENFPMLIMDIGTDDQFLGKNLEYHLALTLLQIPHYFISRPGGHNKEFWREGLYRMFEYIRMSRS